MAANELTIDVIAFIDRALKALDEKFDLKIAALREEYRKSETLLHETKFELEKRLDEMNNFRDQLGRQAATFQTAKDVEEKINLALANRNATIVGLQLQIKLIWGLVATLIALFVAEYLRR